MGKARKFRPALDKFILATTAPNDAALQEAARLLTDEHEAAGSFEVHVMGWDTLKQLVANDRDVVRNHYRDIAPFDLVEALRSETRPELAAIHETLRTLVAQAARPSTLVQPQGPPPPAGTLLARLREVTDLCNDGEPRAAIRMLDRIRADAWDRSGPEDRGRILVGLAFCRLAGCDERGALDAFREAYAIAPGHPGVSAAMVLATLISGDREGAYDLAAGALSDDPSCELPRPCSCRRPRRSCRSPTSWRSSPTGSSPSPLRPARWPRPLPTGTCAPKRSAGRRRPIRWHRTTGGPPRSLVPSCWRPSPTTTWRSA